MFPFTSCILMESTIKVVWPRKKKEQNKKNVSVTVFSVETSYHKRQLPPTHIVKAEKSDTRPLLKVCPLFWIRRTFRNVHVEIKISLENVHENVQATAAVWKRSLCNRHCTTSQLPRSFISCLWLASQASDYPSHTFSHDI